ncbi:MAG TPA: RluA family pseudouridine synthase [Quisquiliibacterium sp.]|nr:RluA family pseudouridine synthase [Quisquiliibacterium sp.]
MKPDDYSEGPFDEALAGDATDAPGPAAAAVPVIELDARQGAGERLDRHLARVLPALVPGVSRTRIQQWIALGAVWCEERPLGASTRLLGIERLRVQPLPREADRAFEPDPVPLEIVEEDEQLIVIDKPAGLVMHPAAGNWRGTLLNGLLHHRPALAALPRAGIVHRLDKDTSGLLVVAKTELALASFSSQLADRSMSRRYFAFVRGVPPAQAEVDVPIGRDPQARVRMAVVDPPAGRPARTFVQRIAAFRLAGQEAALVECRLETGRTHQIRVHLRHLGHPLLGDTLYGGPAIGIERQALHAWRLGLQHPTQGRWLRWISIPPADIRALADAAGVDFGALCNELDRLVAAG